MPKSVSRPRIERYPPVSEAGEGGGGGGIFSRIPPWAWWAIGAVIGIVILIWISGKGLFQGATAGATTPNSTGSNTGGATGGANSSGTAINPSGTATTIGPLPAQFINPPPIADILPSSGKVGAAVPHAVSNPLPLNQPSRTGNLPSVVQAVSVVKPAPKPVATTGISQMWAAARSLPAPQPVRPGANAVKVQQAATLKKLNRIG